MFISLTVKNFKTFSNETFFSMEREGQYRKVKNYINYYLDGRKKRENRLQLLKSTLILGGNQCGKTSLIEAILAMRSLVLEGEFIYIPYGYNNEPIMMAMEFIYQGNLYRYVVSYTESSILLESLEIMDIKEQEYVVIFANDTEHQVPEITSHEASGFFKTIESLSEQTIDRYLWKLKDEKHLTLVLNTLQQLGFDIESLQVQEKISEHQVTSELLIYHTFSKKLAIPFHEENIGLQRVLLLLMMILFNDNSAFYLIDDLETGLYSDTAQSLLMLMNYLDNESQYMVTTRLPQLMDEGLSKDQIYILDRQEDEVFLSSLAEDEELFSIRQNKKYSEGNFVMMSRKEDWRLFIENEF